MRRASSRAASAPRAELLERALALRRSPAQRLELAARRGELVLRHARRGRAPPGASPCGATSGAAVSPKALRAGAELLLEPPRPLAELFGASREALHRPARRRELLARPGDAHLALGHDVPLRLDLLAPRRRVRSPRPSSSACASRAPPRASSRIRCASSRSHPASSSAVASSSMLRARASRRRCRGVLELRLGLRADPSRRSRAPARPCAPPAGRDRAPAPRLGDRPRGAPGARASRSVTSASSRSTSSPSSRVSRFDSSIPAATSSPVPARDAPVGVEHRAVERHQRRQRPARERLRAAAASRTTIASPTSARTSASSSGAKRSASTSRPTTPSCAAIGRSAPATKRGCCRDDRRAPLLPCAELVEQRAPRARCRSPPRPGGARRAARERLRELRRRLEPVGHEAAHAPRPSWRRAPSCPRRPPRAARASPRARGAASASSTARPSLRRARARCPPMVCRSSASRASRRCFSSALVTLPVREVARRTARARARAPRARAARLRGRPARPRSLLDARRASRPGAARSPRASPPRSRSRPAPAPAACRRLAHLSSARPLLGRDLGEPRFLLGDAARPASPPPPPAPRPRAETTSRSCSSRAACSPISCASPLGLLLARPQAVEPVLRARDRGLLGAHLVLGGEARVLRALSSTSFGGVRLEARGLELRLARHELRLAPRRRSSVGPRDLAAFELDPARELEVPVRRLVELQVLELVPVGDVALGLRRLALERRRGCARSRRRCRPTRSRFCCVSSIFCSACFFRALNLVMPAASSMSRRRSSGLALTMRPILPCSTIEYAFVPAPVPRKRSVTSFRRTGVLLIEVVAVAVAVEAARDGDLGVVPVLDGDVAPVVVLEGRASPRRSRGAARVSRAAEDDVLHRCGRGGAWRSARPCTSGWRRRCWTCRSRSGRRCRGRRGRNGRRSGRRTT